MKNFNQRVKFGIKLGLPQAQAKQLARLRTPKAVQDFVDTLAPNFEPNGDTLMSVKETLRRKRAHCIEAALIAACALWINGEKPLLMDLRAHRDYDHVVAIFKHRGCWGAISRSNHIWLRWRDPVYRSLRELAMSYFNEYTSIKRRTLRAYSIPFDLRQFDPALWVTATEPCWEVGAAIDDVRHRPLLTSAQARELRVRDALELRADQIVRAKKAP